MSSSMSVVDIERIFIEKLTEKYKLNDRDIKRAFAQFDVDGNGLLDLDELQNGFKLFLNGVSNQQIQQLIAMYDINGDNKISFEEFVALLRSRHASLTDPSRRSRSNAPSLAQVQSREVESNPRRDRRPQNDDDYGGADLSSLDIRPSASRGRRQDPRKQPEYDDQDYDGSSDNYNYRSYDDPRRDVRKEDRERYLDRRNADIENIQSAQDRREAWGQVDRAASSSLANGRGTGEPELDFTNPEVLEAQAQIFLSGLHALLSKRAKELRIEGKVRDQLTLSATELTENVATKIIDKAFQAYTGAGDSRGDGQGHAIGFPEFGKVLRSFKAPGGPTVRVEVLRYLFSLCEVGSAPVQYLDNGVLVQDPESEEMVADPRLLVPLIFGDGRHTSGSGKKINNTTRSQVPALAIDGNPTLNPSQHGRVSGLTGGALGQKSQKRTLVGSGPMIMDGAIGRDAAAARETSLEVVPLRFVSRKSRTSLATPTNFNFALARRSANLPNYRCAREHMFGVAPSLMAGRLLHSKPTAPEAYTGSRRSVAGGNSSLPQCTLVYAAASVGVVHDVATNRQHFFDGHTDDISCIALATSGLLAATGCVSSAGKLPVVMVWDTSPAALDSQSNGLLATLGHGFFGRAVNAVSFAYDAAFVVAVGADDQHMLGVWSLPQGLLIAQAPCLHGTPEMFMDLQCSPSQTFTEWITRDHAGSCDVICSAGEHHLRLWSLRRPPAMSQGASAITTTDTALESQTSLTFKSCVLPQEKSSKPTSVGATSTAPKAYTCVAFTALPDGSFDLLSGANNGVVYCWRKGVCVANANVIRGGIRCIVASGDKAVCGGHKGIIKVLDARTLASVATYTASGSDLLSGVRPSSSQSTGSGGLNSPRPGSSDGSINSPRPRSGSAVRGRPGSASSSAGSGRPASAGRFGVRPGSAGGGSSAGAPSPVSAASRLKKQQQAVAMASGAAASAGNAAGGLDDEALTNITSITVVASSTVGGSGSSVGVRPVYIVATTSAGKAVRIEAGKVMASTSSSASLNGKVTSALADIRPLFYYHSGALVALSAEGAVGSIGSMMVTGGDDRRICVWDTVDRCLLTRTSTQSAVRSLHMDRSGHVVAAGFSSGAISLYSLQPSNSASSAFNLALIEECFRKDSKSEISDIKISPDNRRLAAGSSDSCIYVYRCNLDPGNCVVRPMHKLTGHSSHITHLDWSDDSALIQSTCGAYELLCWEAESGKLYTTVSNANIQWKTETCILGFGVMGIWPPCADGTDINAVDVSKDRGLVVTADDSGFLNLLNYPCVVKNAPRKTYSGHSAHVMNVRLLERGNDCLVAGTVGGRDTSFQMWNIIPASEDAIQQGIDYSKRRSYTTALN